jgi:hypothetical protein
LPRIVNDRRIGLWANPPDLGFGRGAAFGAGAERPKGRIGEMEETSVKYELVDINEIL